MANVLPTVAAEPLVDRPVAGPETADLLKAATAPLRAALDRRNAFFDWLFYDVAGLTMAERAALLAETNLEGSILVVFPEGTRGDVSIVKFDDYAALRNAPGGVLERFTIAGVGSSDVGAAAFARTVANHYGEPVGAIVSGYGVSDLLAEAAGGWFVMGMANRVMNSYHATLETMSTLGGRLRPEARTAPTGPRRAVQHRDDSHALLRLLGDPDRSVKFLAGHSKGCLSIAYALEALALGSDRGALDRAASARIVTTGAVVALPTAFHNVAQYIGGIDWFGGMNSRLELPATRVPNAWHHLNTQLPFHFDFAAQLAAAGR